MARPLQLRKGDTFQTKGAMRTVEFKVMDIATATEEEAEYCYVNEDTEILYEGEALKVHMLPYMFRHYVFLTIPPREYM